MTIGDRIGIEAAAQAKCMQMPEGYNAFNELKNGRSD
jgi:hypothetical protein